MGGVEAYSTLTPKNKQAQLCKLHCCVGRLDSALQQKCKHVAGGVMQRSSTQLCTENNLTCNAQSRL